MFLLCILSSFSYAEPIPAGEKIEQAVLVDIPEQGFDSLEGVLPSLIPSPIEIPEFSEDGGSCPLGGYWYRFVFKDALADIEVSSVDLTPDQGHMDLQMELSIKLNDSADRFRFNYWLGCVKYRCRGYVDPFSATVLGEFSIAFTDAEGDGAMEADVIFSEDLSIDVGLTGDHIQLEECPLNFLEDVFQFFGGSLYDIVLNSIGIDSIISDAIPELEQTIEEALDQSNIDETIDLSGITLRFQLEPSEVLLQPEGMRMIFNASSTVTEPAECIQEYDPGSSKGTENPSVTLEEFPPSYDFGAVAIDDFVNQTLYSIWAGGALCQSIDQDTFALDTSILNLLTGDRFIDLFPETQPMILNIDPQKPPTLNLERTADIGVDIEEMGLEFYAELDFRSSRVLAIHLNAPVDVDLAMDNTTGELDLAINIDTLQASSQVYFNEFLPQDSTQIEDAFTGQLDTILGLVDIDGLLGDVNLAVPAIALGEGSVGLQNIDFNGTGAQQEDLGIYANLGPVSYSSGCGSEEEEGCGGGCSSVRGGLGRSLLGVLIILGALRRRM